MNSRTARQGGILFLLLLICGAFQPPSLLTSHSTTSVTSFTHQMGASSPLELPFFPLGIYGVLNSTDIWESWNNWFNTVPIGFSEAKDFELPIEDMLHTCDTLGMRVLFDTSYFLRQRALDDMLDLVLSVIGHPSIYAWYIVDEPGLFLGDINGTHIDENVIREAVEIIHRIDSRPTFVQFSLRSGNESFWEAFDEVPDFVDIISVDPYPNMPYTNHSIVSDWVDRILQYNAGRAKVWAILTAQDFSQSLGEKGFDIPTEAEYLLDAVLALQRGVEGMLWFAFGHITGVDLGAYAFPTSWKALSRVVRRISQVAPILVGRENEMQPVPVEGKLEAAYARRGSQTVLLLANHDYYWNGSETEWRLRPIPVTLEAQDVLSVSRIEPEGLVPIEFKMKGRLLLFNVTVEGGMILLIESATRISLAELEFRETLWTASLMLMVTVGLFWLRKRIMRRGKAFRRSKEEDLLAPPRTLLYL